MSKIEEITEILVNEMDSFEKEVLKLETINEKLNITKVKIDLKEYKSIIEFHQQRMKEQINSQEQFEDRFERLLKKAKVYPNWAVIVFIASLLFGIVSFVYSYNAKQNFNLLEKEAYQKGINHSNNYIQTFFESHPKSKQAFEKWKKKNDKEH